jgi:hypothetical protein
MKMLIFSDIHGDRAALERLVATDADVYVAAGDLTNFARNLDPLGRILQARARETWVLPGNHEHATHIEEFCAKFGLNPLHGRTFEREGWTVAGLGYSNPTPFNTPGEYSEDELARRLQPFAGQDRLILVCHVPPKGTDLDRAALRQHFGSTAVRDFIERNQPDWFFCGHIHEAEGREARIGETRAVNVGKRGYLLEV